MNAYANVIAACLCVASPLLCAAPYGVDFWRDAEGLSQSRIRAIAQTRDGYLWLATDGGLVRFNGSTFRAFNADTGDLKDNEVWALQEDNEGGLWIGTYGGGLTLLKNGRFKTFTEANGLPDDVIMALDKDIEGNIWMITPQGAAVYSHGVFRLAGPHIGAMCAGLKSGVLYGTRPGLEQMMCGADGSVWMGLNNGLITRLKDGITSTYRPQAGRGRQINKLYEDPHGAVWAVVGQQLTRLDNGVFRPVALEAGAPDPGNIYSLFMDREDNLWVGLQSNGLARLRTRPLSALSTQDGLPDNRTRAVYQDSRGDIWIGTAEGLARLSNGKISTWTELGDGRLRDVRSIAEDSLGNLWFSAGDNLLSLRNGRVSKVPGWEARYEIEAMYKDPQGRIWIGTDGAGLFRYDGRGFTHFQKQDGLGGNHVRAVMADRDGALWVSTFGAGVTRYAGGIFTVFTSKDGLGGDRVVAMHEDEQGAMWFATRRGLSRLKDGKWFTFTADSGLNVSFVYTIVDDARGNFWFSSAQGIFRVSKAELRACADGQTGKVLSVAYGVKDGLGTRAGNLGNQPAACRTREGRLLFSSMKGIAIVDPGRMEPTDFVPPVYIEKVLVNRHDVPPGQDYRSGRGAGEIEIQYAALSYSAPEKLRFRYMLDGIDRDWVEAGNRRFTYYANLPPGNYRFRVTACNADGVWDESGASFAFHLTPPFYRTWQAGVISLLVLSGLVWGLYRLRMHGLKLRYTAVLGERNRISRDLHDTLAQNLAGIALQLDSVNMHLDDVHGPLRERLDQACDLTRYSLAEARRAIFDLRSDELDSKDLSVVLPEIAERSMVKTGVHIHGLPRKLNPVAEKNLLRIYQEALANAVKHARAKSIDVDLTYTAHGVGLRVYDDGCGFDMNNIELLGGGHFGLLGMRERAERIGAKFELTSAPGEGTELRVEVPL